MTDRYDQDLILGYVEGELDDAQRDAFEATLADDHELRNLVSQIKLDRENLRSLRSAPAPVGLIDQVFQTQERAALLGEPEVPEPLPMVLPVSRRKFRRVLAYSGIAAVLLLSAALVLPTLMPPGLLDFKTQTAGRPAPSSGTLADKPRGKGSGLAMVDEDAAYDRAAARSITRPGGDSAGAAKDAVPPADAPIAAAPRDAELPEEKVANGQPALARTGPAISQDQPEAPAAAAPAMAERADAPADTVGPVLSQPARTEPDTPAEDVHLAKAAPVDPFMGYAEAQAPDVAGNTQLLINAASPTRARRDLRDWAIAHSAIVQDPSSPAGPDGADAQATTDRSRALTAAVAGNTPTQMTVEIDPSQVPELLAYLNRNADQRAELVAPADGLTDTPSAGQANERTLTRTAARQARDAERNESADPATALTNRMVDTQSAWPNPGRASGLAPTQPDADQRRAQPQQAEPIEESPLKPAESPQPDAAGPKPFDWGRLLDAVTTRPADTPAPLLQPEPRQRVRLTVVINQVPTDAPGQDD